MQTLYYFDHGYSAFNHREAKTEFEQLASKAKKTPEEKAMLEKWRTQLKHWKKKKDWGGEQHSQKNKGT